MGAGLAVPRDDGPAVVLLVNLPGAHGDHRFDGDGHARLQPDAAPGPPVIRHVGILVHLDAYAVAAQIPDHAVAVGLRIGLNRIADVPQMVSGHRLSCAQPEAVFRCVHQLLCLRIAAAHHHGKRAVGLPAIQYAGAIDGEQLPLAELVAVWKAVNHLIIDGSTDGCGKAVVALGRRDSPAGADQPFGHLIQMLRGDARLDLPAQGFQHLVEQSARIAHFFDLCFVLDRDHVCVTPASRGWP